MFSFIEETFLREYFLHNVILGNCCERKNEFDYFAKTFKIDPERAKGLFALTEQPAVREITTEADANRYKRIVQFQTINKKPSLYDEQTDAIITLKMEAITIASEMDLCVEGKASKSKIYQMLLDRASGGSVDAMRVLGALQINGFFVEENRSAGRENLDKSSKWGDVLAMFLLVRSGVANSNLENNFYFATQDTPYWALYKIADIEPFIPVEEQAEVLLLNKLFTYKTVKRNVYSEPHAHVIYATGISNEDKERLLFSDNKQLLSDALNLPIYRPIDNDLPCDFNAIKKMPLHRESEQNKILAALRNRDIRDFETYRPLCLCTNSQYLQELYFRAFVECFNYEFIERIDVHGLQEEDFEPTSNNVFVRNCKCQSDGIGTQKLKNDTNNVFVLFLSGDISNAIMKHVKEFLTTERRRQFRLMRPNITLDFGYTLPICICDSENAKKLKTFVEAIQLADIDNEESSKLIDVMLKKKAGLYFGKKVELTDNAVEQLAKLPMEAVEEIVDIAYRSQRALLSDEGKIAFAIKPYIDSYEQQHSERGFGFGGYNK